MATLIKSGKPLGKLAGDIQLERGGQYVGSIDVAGDIWITAVGFGPRPIIKVPTGQSGIVCNRTLSRLVVDHVDFVPVDPKAAGRKELLAIRGAVARITLDHVNVSRGGTNIVLEGLHGAVTLNEVRSEFAGAPAADSFRGQGAYIAIPARANGNDRGASVSIIASVFHHNGWEDGGAEAERNIYRHNIYHQYESCPLHAADSIFSYAPNAGIQSRSPAKYTRCAFVKNGCGVLAVDKIQVDLADCLFLGGGYFAMKNAAGQRVWVGNSAVTNYATLVNMKNVAIFGLPGQSAPNKSYSDQGCLIGSKTYTPHPERSGGGAYQFSNVRVNGWPGKTYAGDKPPSLSGSCVGALQPLAWADGWIKKIGLGTATAKEALALAGVV